MRVWRWYRCQLCNGSGVMTGMGRTFQRGPVWWVAYYHRGVEHRESTRLAGKKGANRLATRPHIPMLEEDNARQGFLGSIVCQLREVKRALGDSNTRPLDS